MSDDSLEQPPTIKPVPSIATDSAYPARIWPEVVDQAGAEGGAIRAMTQPCDCPCHRPTCDDPHMPRQPWVHIGYPTDMHLYPPYLLVPTVLFSRCQCEEGQP